MHRINNIIKHHKQLFIFLFIYVLVRILLINVNYTEWGDSFRMIRGAEYLAKGDWPWDEKRWPFYSILLIPGILANSPVLWGRIISLFSSIGTLIFVYKFYLQFINSNKNYAVITAVLTSLNGIFAYWSFRVMADPVFTFLIILFSYLFMKWNTAKSYSKNSYKQTIILSIILLTITMTRLEGLFIAVSCGLYLLITRASWKKIFILYIPQILIYLPWTIYAKFLYSGSVQNDYLIEAQGFIFNFDRFQYFLAYSLFVLVVPAFVYFIYIGLKKIIKENISNWIVILGFIFLEILIGFIWTPSLPRIYMPIIPFLTIFSVYGIQIFDAKKSKLSYILSSILLLGLFIYLQYTLKLYFLGASKLLFLILIIGSIKLIFFIYFEKSFKRFLIVGLVIFNLLISFVVIYNQRLVYKTVKQAIDFSAPTDEKIAYSDETGNTEWYLRNNFYYLEQKFTVDSNEQYAVLKNSSSQYLIWTNEFNRGSSFIDPKDDARYDLVAIYSQPIIDPFDVMLDKLGLVEDNNFQVFVSKVYLVNFVNEEVN